MIISCLGQLYVFILSRTQVMIAAAQHFGSSSHHNYTYSVSKIGLVGKHLVFHALLFWWALFRCPFAKALAVEQNLADFQH